MVIVRTSPFHQYNSATRSATWKQGIKDSGLKIFGELVGFVARQEQNEHVYMYKDGEAVRCYVSAPGANFQF